MIMKTVRRCSNLDTFMCIYYSVCVPVSGHPPPATMLVLLVFMKMCQCSDEFENKKIKIMTFVYHELYYYIRGTRVVCSRTIMSFWASFILAVKVNRWVVLFLCVENHFHVIVNVLFCFSKTM